MATALANGVNYSWANITATIAGVPVLGITKIEYKAMQEKTNNYGAGSQPISRGYGRVEYEGSIELFTDELKRIIAAAPNRDLLQVPFFDINLVLGGTGVLASTEVLRATEFLENPFTATEGDTVFKVTVPIIFAAVER
jgi:hypothetical protein